MQLYAKYISIIILFTFNLIKSESHNRNIDFTIEDHAASSVKNSRHLHNLRHAKGTHSHSYLGASSTVTNSRQSNRLESFSLNCPHVVDSSSEHIQTEVIWTLNDTVWLKIENGQLKIVNGESTFSKKRVSGKTVMRILLNSARYKFEYDEITGDFSMEISPVIMAMDNGSWQCHVIVRKDGKSHTLTSRRRIRIPKETPQIEKLPSINKKGNEEHNLESATLSYTRENADDPKRQLNIQKRGDRSRLSNNYPFSKVASFSRQDEDTVYMTRKEQDGLNSVIFARNDRRSDHKSMSNLERENLRWMHAQIDYELDMDDDSMYGYANLPRTRERSALYFNTSMYQSSYLSIISLLLIFHYFVNV